MNNNKIFGYARVSTKEQNLARQLEALKEYGIEDRDIFFDQQSGKDFNREQYILLKKMLRSGDTLIIKELDRLGRDMEGIKSEWNYFLDNGISIIILDMPILNTSNKSDLEKKLISDIVLSLLSYLAEKERMKIRQRQQEGIVIAKAEGKYKGRKRKPIENFQNVYNQWKNNEISALKACKIMNISSPTFYRRIKEYDEMRT